MLSSFQQAIASYQNKLNKLTESEDVSVEQVIATLLSRNRVQVEIKNELAVDPVFLQQIVLLDQKLRQAAFEIDAAATLEKLRQSYQPKTEWWWWYLDRHLIEKTNVIDSLEQAIQQISGRNSETFLATAVEAFRARDCAQHHLASGQMNTTQLLKLLTLDRTLKQKINDSYRSQSLKEKRAIVNGLEEVKDSLQPDPTARWWYPRLRINWLDYFDPLWTTLTLVWLAGTFGLLTDIATRFLESGSPGTFGSIAIIVQSFLALVGGGAVTQKGQAIVDRMLSRWSMPRRFRQRFIFIGATALLVLFVGFRLSLPNAAIRYNNSATDDYVLGNLGSAEAKLKKAIELDPNYERAHYNLGVIYEDLGKYNEAKVQYNLAIAGASIPAYNNKARLLIIEGDYRTAINLLNKGIVLVQKNATDVDPDNDTSPIIEHDLWKNLGWAEYLMGYFDDAITDLKTAISIAINNEEQEIEASPYCLLAQTYEAMSMQEQAKPAWEGCLEYAKDPNNPEENDWQKLAQERLKS